MHEIREVLRLWVRGEGQRSVARHSAVDRKTVRRYVEAAVACGVERDGGEGERATIVRYPVVLTSPRLDALPSATPRQM